MEPLSVLCPAVDCNTTGSKQNNSIYLDHNCFEMSEPIDSTPKKENKLASQSKQDMIFFALNYFVPFYGLRMALEDYLATDRMPLTDIFLLGLLGAIITVPATLATRHKKLQVKIFASGVLLLVMILINLYLV
jgi:hypothetical protein